MINELEKRLEATEQLIQYHEKQIDLFANNKDEYEKFKSYLEGYKTAVQDIMSEFK